MMKSQKLVYSSLNHLQLETVNIYTYYKLFYNLQYIIRK